MIWTPNRKIWTPRKRLALPSRQRGMFALTHLSGFGGGEAPFFAAAADFDGTSDYATRGANLTNANDSKLMTFVMWQKADSSASKNYFGGFTTVGGSTPRMYISGTVGLFEVLARNVSGSARLVLQTSTAPSTTAWQCLMCSVDMADTAKRHLYLGDTNELNVVTYTDDTLDFTVADWAVGANADGTTKIDGGLAEVFFWAGVYIDFSVEANRRLFFGANGRPADPNASGGAIATLGVPDVYFHLNRGETANNFVANDDGGDGGAFTVTGALSTYASSPSD